VTRIRRALAVVATMAAALVLTAPSASAASGIELSPDGATWGTTLSGALFGTPARLVPGDVVTATLWVRNASITSARVDLRVAAGIGARDGSFAGDLRLSVDGRELGGGSTWNGPVLAPGGVTRVPLVVTYVAAAGSSGVVQAASVLDSVSLVEADPAPSPTATASTPTSSPTPIGDPTSPAPPGTGGAGGLASTGAAAAREVGVAFAATLAGALLLAAARRRRRPEDA
jgi:hypothetical protein